MTLRMALHALLELPVWFYVVIIVIPFLINAWQETRKQIDEDYNDLP